MIIDRRSLFVLAAALALPARALAAPSRTIPLWGETPPGGGGPQGAVQVSPRGAWSNIATPSLHYYEAEKPRGSAVLVAAGGGYKRIEMAGEAEPAAAWLTARGIAAFVLSYRLPSEGWQAGPLAPLQDAQRAMRLIRARAADYHIDPARIGALGFSAGGHLLGLAATRADFAAYPAMDDADTQSARPDNAALIYPIITLEPPYDQTSTRRVLIGRHPSAGESRNWSVESHVQAGCPPIFLAQAQDDPVSDPANSRMMAQACDDADVPVDLLALPSGGHGFGMGRQGTPTAVWPARYQAWLRQRGMTG